MIKHNMVLRGALVAGVLAAAVAQGADYFVAMDGSNENAGTMAAPFRDISFAAKQVRPGDTVYIRRGNYREKVVIDRSGEAGKPIVFRPYKNETVVVNTADRVKGWKKLKGDVNQDGKSDADMWAAKVDWDAGGNYRNDTLFVNGTMYLEAREGAETDPLDINDYIRIEKGDINFHGLRADGLKGWGDGFWNGAKIFHPTTDWSYFESTVGDYHSDTGQIDFQERLGYIISQKQFFGCYLFDTIKALDKPNEWFKGDGQNTLYYKSEPKKNPNRMLMEFKRRDYTFVLKGADHIHILGMEHRGGALTIDQDSDYALIQGNRFHGYGKHGFGRVGFHGNHHRFVGNEFSNVFTDGFTISGARHDIVNNYFHRIGLYPGSIVINPEKSRELFVSHNTFSMFTRSAMRYFPYQSVISYNVMEDGCRTSWDTGYLDGDMGGGQGGNCLVHHNVFRNGTWYGSGFMAIYSGQNLAVYRNFIYNVGSRPTVHVKPYFSTYWHNTMVGGQPDWEQGRRALNSAYQNNIQLNMGRVPAPGLKISGNHDYAAADFVDMEAGNLKLSRDSGAIDQGVVIPGINDHFNGTAPDAGALEYGEPMWKVGHDFKNPPNVEYDWAPLMGMNLYENGSFIAGLSTQVWLTEGAAGPVNGNGWNVDGISPTGGWSYRVRPGAKAYQTFDRVHPNSRYRVLTDARLVNELIQVEAFADSSGEVKVLKHRSEKCVEGLDADEWLSYGPFDFGDGTLYDRLELCYSRYVGSDPAHAETSALEVRVGAPDGKLLGTVTYSTGIRDSFGVVQCALEPVAGEQTVYLVAKGPNAGTMWLNCARFYKLEPAADDKLIVRIRDHGRPEASSRAGKPLWDGKFEEMRVKTGDGADSITVEFENPGPYDAYIDRFAVFEEAVEPAPENIAATDAAITKERSSWKAEFQYDLNPTRITVVNGAEKPLAAMRVNIRDKAGKMIWSKGFGGAAFKLVPGAEYEIPGNEVGEGGGTRLASVLCRVIEVEKVGPGVLDLADVIVSDGYMVPPKGNLAITGKAKQSNDYYRKQGRANLANNGIIFPVAEFTTTLKEPNPYWQVELAQDSDIEQIVVFNRIDAAERIGDFRVSALDADGAEIWGKNYSYRDGDLPAGGSLTINEAVSGVRYVKVEINGAQLLSLPEVQIWGQ